MMLVMILVGRFVDLMITLVSLARILPVLFGILWVFFCTLALDQAF